MIEKGEKEIKWHCEELKGKHWEIIYQFEWCDILQFKTFQDVRRDTALTTHWGDSMSVSKFSSVLAWETQPWWVSPYLDNMPWSTTISTSRTSVPWTGCVHLSQSWNISLLSNDPGAIPAAIMQFTRLWRPISAQRSCLLPTLLFLHRECLIFPSGSPTPLIWFHQTMTTISLVPLTREWFTMKFSLPKPTVCQNFDLRSQCSAHNSHSPKLPTESPWSQS